MPPSCKLGNYLNGCVLACKCAMAAHVAKPLYDEQKEKLIMIMTISSGRQ